MTAQTLSLAGAELYGHDGSHPNDVIQGHAMALFKEGAYTKVWAVFTDNLRKGVDPIPPGADIIREFRGKNSAHVLAIGDGYMMTLEHRPLEGRAWGRVYCHDLEVGQEAVAFWEGLKEEDTPNTLPFTFWFMSDRPSQSTRMLEIVKWPDINKNYTAPAQHELERLMKLDKHHNSGKLLLMHGPPGTGKTTALRSLAWEWRDWSEVEFVIDSERLFSDSGYLMHVLLNGGRSEKKHRLLVLEDCDELVSASAKQRAGQALSRLLNITDGMIGQGLNIRICITTNEPLATLHPAIIRPGRCLAQIHVGKLTSDEATAWLGRPVHGDNTLAELYALSGSVSEIKAEKPEERQGLYL